MPVFHLDDAAEDAKVFERSADEQQALDAMLDFDADTPAPPDFEPAPPEGFATAVRAQHLTKDDPRVKQAHALDTAPTNSKIVVTDRGAVLATPDVVKRLPDGDPAHKLPRNVKIHKLGTGHFRASIPTSDGPNETLEGTRVNALIADVLSKVHGD